MKPLPSRAEFWSGKTVFLTGHTGFKGAWLSLWLSMLGAKIHGMSLAPVDRNIFVSARIQDILASSVIADIRDFQAVKAALAASGADTVIHMAAQSLVKSSFEDPLTTYSTNVMGTANVLEAIRQAPSVRAAVIVTTDKCYENREWVWGYRENEPMGGYDPYSSSKGCAELVTSAFRQSFFGTPEACRIASARAGNVIGGGDCALNRLIPDLIRSLREDRKTMIRSPHAIRPWQHVLEPLSGYLSLAQHLLSPDGTDFGEAWNFGPDQTSERTVKDVVESVCLAWGNPGAWDYDRGPHAHEASFLKLDSSKANHKLGWRPNWNFDKAIQATISWYRAESADQDMFDFTKRQILEYSSA